MGRQPTFEWDDVLNKTAQVFVRSGFQRTTIKDITEATGLQPGSIYSAFGNKTNLYTEVIDYYTKRQISFLNACEEQNSTILEALKAFFKLTGDNITSQTPDAHCLLVCGAYEIPENEKELRYYIQLRLQEVESRIHAMLVKAQKNNEIIHEEDPIELSQFLMTMLFGHRVLTKLQTNPDTINCTIDRVFRALE